MPIRFREHRGHFDESVKTKKTFRNKQELITHCRSLLRPYGFRFRSSDLHVLPYDSNLDKRIGWKETWMVSIDGYGIMGFTDRNC